MLAGDSNGVLADSPKFGAARGIPKIAFPGLAQPTFLQAPRFQAESQM